MHAVPLTGAAAGATAVLLLAVVLVFTVVAPRGLPEAIVAVPAAGLTVLLGILSPAQALDQVRQLAPTVGFLAAILALAHLADAEGVFDWLGSQLARGSAGGARRLLGMVFLAAAATTAVLSLDATVVLLTPVVLATAARLRLGPRPHLYACTHLANSASTLLPVSNLTNLLAFGASGLSFLGFAALMGLPWLSVIAVEYLLFRRFFATELAATTRVPPTAAAPAPPLPRYAFTVLGLTLLGFGVSGFIGLEPGWVAAAGVAVLGARALARREITPPQLVREAAPLFAVFVLALGIVVAGVTEHGLGEALAAITPNAPSLLGLLAVAGLAAVLANLVNNLPATLVMLQALGASPHPGIVLAMLLGVNIGPNLTYAGSLATLLWRRVLVARGAAPALSVFLRLGVATVPACLVVAVVALWLGLTGLGLTGPGLTGPGPP